MICSIYIGCVADDFTGASDIASFFVKSGLRTILLNGIPEQTALPSFSADAVVIALKSRTAPKKQAVKNSLAAFSLLKELGAQKLYFKYCSTFDSTEEGNIGPVADAVMERFQIPYTILCPALPVNGRTVKDGKLYVNGVLLEDSSMKDHPLTPMRESRLSSLIGMQSRYQGIAIGASEYASVLSVANSYCQRDGHCYLIPDYEREEDGEKIAEIFQDLIFYTGGSGLAEHLGKQYQKQVPVASIEPIEERTEGRALLLSGSCSLATLGQIADYQEKGYPCYKINVEKVLQEQESAEQIFQFIRHYPDGNVLVYSSDRPEMVKKAQAMGRETVAEALEALMKALAIQAVLDGFQKIIVAGGETSGAVIKGLQEQGFWIGKSIAPGVPVMIPITNPHLRLVLKSGNFGQEDFFERAITELEVKR